MKSDQRYDQIAKYILIGDSKVGKTSIVNSFCRNQFNLQQPSTLNLEYGEKNMILTGKHVKIQLWDTSVHDNFRLMIPSLYKSVAGIFLIFSVDNRDSFNSIALWVKQIEAFAGNNIPVILLCNKADLNKRQVSQKEAQALADAFSFQIFMVSAKSRINIEESVVKMYQKVKKQSQALQNIKNIQADQHSKRPKKRLIAGESEKEELQSQQQQQRKKSFLSLLKCHW